MGPVFGPDKWPSEEKSRRREMQNEDSRFLLAYGQTDKENGRARAPPAPEPSPLLPATTSSAQSSQLLSLSSSFTRQG